MTYKRTGVFFKEVNMKEANSVELAQAVQELTAEYESIRDSLNGRFKMGKLRIRAVSGTGCRADFSLSAIVFKENITSDEKISLM
jgi:hypothetical protein